MDLELELLKPQIENGETLRLSSGFTKTGAILSLLIASCALVFVMPVVLYGSPVSTIGKLFVGLLLLTLVVLAFYQFAFACYAELSGKKLFLKKIWGKTYEVEVDQVEKISSFASKNTRYTHLRFKDDSGSTQKALILNSNSALFGQDIPAGVIIQLAQQVGKR